MTAKDLIEATYRLLGAIDPDEPLSASMAADGLEALQLLIDSWSGQGLMIYAQTSEALNLTSAISYTIGTGGTFNTARPDQVVGGYITSGGLDYPLSIIDANAYRTIAQKSNSGTPSWLFYSPEFPLGKIYIHPAPGSGDVLHLDSLKPLSEPATLVTALSFPPGYKRAMKYALALDLGPEVGKSPDPAIVGIAKNCLDNIQSKNAAAKAETVKLEILNVSRRYSIDAG